MLRPDEQNQPFGIDWWFWNRASNLLLAPLAMGYWIALQLGKVPRLTTCVTHSYTHSFISNISFPAVYQWLCPRKQDRLVRLHSIQLKREAAICHDHLGRCPTLLYSSSIFLFMKEKEETSCAYFLT